MRTLSFLLLRCSILFVGTLHHHTANANLIWKEGANKLFGDKFQPDGDQFGHSVAIDDDLLVVGAYEDTPNGDGSGAVYVFQRMPDNPQNWTQVAMLEADDGKTGDNFGWSVAIQDDIIAVGAQKRSEETGENEQGAVYIFDTTDFIQIQKITAPDGGQNDFFGFSISLDLPVLVVGAPFDDNGVVESGGSVYAYNNEAGDFEFTDKILTTEDTAVSDFFGYSVAVSNNTFVTSAIGDDDIGSAYVYVTDDYKNWTQQQRIASRKSGRQDEVGRAVAIENDVIVLGAGNNRQLPWFLGFLPQIILNFLSVFNNNLGVAYVFKRENGVWSETAKLHARIPSLAKAFGRSVAIKDSRIIVGAPNAFRLRGTRVQAGSIYVFKPCGRQLKHWRLQCKLSPFDIQDNDEFGQAVAFSNGTIVVGSRQEDQLGFAAGAAYTFYNTRMVQLGDGEE